MDLPDEKSVIRMLQRIKQEGPPPRQDWKRIGKERLMRQVSTIQRKQRISRASAFVATLGVAALMGIWISSGQLFEKSTNQPLAQSQASQLPSLLQGLIKDSAAHQQVAASQEAKTPPAAEHSTATSEKSADSLDAGKAQATETSQSAQETFQSVAPKQEQTPASRSKTPLEERAEQYLRERLGATSGQYQIDPVHSRPAEGYIAFRLVMQGVPFQENSAAVKVNQSNGEMSLLLYPDAGQPDKISALPAQTNLVDKATAAQELAATLSLVYSGKTQPFLRYMPDVNTLIDAHTGKRITSGNAEKTVAAVKGEGKRLTINDRHEAAAIMQQTFGIEVAGDASLNIEKRAISYTWGNGEKNTATLKADDDGNFIGYFLKGPFKQANTSVSSLQQAQEIALDQLANYLPANVREVRVDAVNQREGQASFTFVPLYQGIPVIDYTYSVTVDMASAIVTSMEGDFTQAAFKLPDKAKAIPLAEAASLFAQEVPMEVVYSVKERKTPMLVYQMRMESAKPWVIDALSGKLVE